MTFKTLDPNRQPDSLREIDPLDQAITAITSEALDEAAVEAASGRVWQRLAAVAAAGDDVQVVNHAGMPDSASPGAIQGCAGFQALMPAYLRGALEPAHRLLVEDHSRGCVACRKALNRLRRGEPITGREDLSTPRAAATGSARRWALAAGLAGLALMAGLAARQFSASGTTEVQVRSISGELQRLDASDSFARAHRANRADRADRALAAGQRFGAGEVVRTANGSSAVLELEDGSQVEMAERSEIKLERRRGGLVVDLARGGVIVEAARQPSARRLFVRTGDCMVAVTGTIFSVSHGAKGSRVSVIDGEVEIEGRGARLSDAERATRGGMRSRRVGAGHQWATRAELVSVPLDREIAWSHNAGSYRTRLRALHALGQDLNQLDRALTVPGRTSTRLLDVMPADTVAYLAAPNVSSSLGEAWDRLQDRLDEDPELRAWWDTHFGGGEAPADIDQYLTELREFGAELGPEIAVSIGVGTIEPGEDGDPVGEPGLPVLAAEVPRPESFSSLLDAEIARLNSRPGEHIRLRRVTTPTPSDPSTSELLVWLRGDVLLASPDVARLVEVGGALEAGGRGAFAGTPFHARLASIYAEGAGWVAAVDVSRLVSDEAATTAGQLGVADLDHVVFNSTARDDAEGAQHRAVFDFARERRGVASWLAAPAPIGALDFVSPEANFAFAGVFKDPDDMLADALALGRASDRDGFRDLGDERLAALRQDLASALGGDVAFALDGPWLPQPSWKLAVEVYDRDRLQATLEALVQEWNRAAAARGDSTPDPVDPVTPLALSEEAVGGRVVYLLSGPHGAVHFLYEDGYLLAGPNRALLLDSLDQRSAGISLGHSARFTQLLPRDHEMHFSAVVYQNLGAVGSALGDWLGQKNDLSAGDREAIQSLATSGGPGLIVAYGGSDRVEVVGKSEDGFLGHSFSRLLGLAAVAAARAPGQAPEPIEAAAPARVRRRVA